MKRRLLSILLALVLTLALLPTAALAEGVTWTKINQTYINNNRGNQNYITLTTGNYQFIEDIQLNERWSLLIQGTVTLDLNGCKLEAVGYVPDFIFVGQGAALTLVDNSTAKTGVIRYSDAVSYRNLTDGVYLYQNSSFIMEGGTIECVPYGVAGTSNCTFTMNGGVIQNCEVGVANGGTMYANGGTVKDCTAYAMMNSGTVQVGSGKTGTVFDGKVESYFDESTTLAGAGTKNSPFELTTAAELKAFRDKVNAGEYSACAKLTDDIVLNANENWTPIGNYTTENQIFYKGTFDGNGHTISGLNVTGDFQYAGLFGVVTGGTIKNLTVAGNVFSNSSDGGAGVGGIVGQASYSTTIENCSNHCRVTSGGGASVGGIAGYNVDGATITDCYNVGTITGARTSAGGIAGGNSGTISNCYNVGTVSEGTNVGEIIGHNMCNTVENCYYLNTTNNKDVGNDYSTNTKSMTAAEFADGTVLKLLMANRKYDAQPWDSKCRLVDAVSMTLPVFKWQAPEEPAPSESSSGSRFSYSTISASAGENGKISPSGDLSVRSDLGQTFTFTPDKGYRVADVLVNGKSVGALRSYTFATARSDQTIEVMFEKIPAFTDVPAGAYYAEAVNWALENWITEGTSDTLFSPDAPCTRAQAVTFLWRAAGCPAPSSYSMPFEDVKSDSYYYQAVLWAIENGIAQGTSETTFEPDAVCTRAQIVCFLFRFKAANGMDAVTLAELLGGFADSAEIPAYSRSALNWALSANVLQGCGAKLLPNDACTRAQIVTLLYRAMR